MRRVIRGLSLDPARSGPPKGNSQRTHGAAAALKLPTSDLCRSLAAPSASRPDAPLDPTDWWSPSGGVPGAEAATRQGVKRAEVAIKGRKTGKETRRRELIPAHLPQPFG